MVLSFLYLTEGRWHCTCARTNRTFFHAVHVYLFFLRVFECKLKGLRKPFDFVSREYCWKFITTLDICPPYVFEPQNNADITCSHNYTSCTDVASVVLWDSVSSVFYVTPFN